MNKLNRPIIDGDFSIIPSKLDFSNIRLGENIKINEINTSIDSELNIDTYYIINFIKQQLDILLGDEESDICINKAIVKVLNNMKTSTDLGKKIIYQEVKIHRLENKAINYNEKIKHLECECSTDILTGIGNRRFIEKELNKAIALKNRHGKDSSIILIDIDYFKKINDEYGHDIGDKALIEISNILIDNTRENDALGRFGGEEFILILPRTNIEDAEEKANKIRQIIQNKLGFSIQEINKEITVSIGVSQTNSIEESAMTLFKKADVALYNSKGNGRNQVQVHKNEA